MLLTRDEFAARVKDAGVKLRLRRTLRYVPEVLEHTEHRDFIAVFNKARTEE